MNTIITHSIKIVLIFFSVFILASSSLVAFVIFDEKEETTSFHDSDIDKTSVFVPDIIVPDDYTTIQEAINHAGFGDKILVRPGVYKENVDINKEGIFLKGQNKLNTVINGNYMGDVVVISATDVTMQGFTILNGYDENKVLWDLSGVKISSSNVAVKDNIIKKNRLGICVMSPIKNITIEDNQLMDDGILLGNYVYSGILTVEDFIHTISNNTVDGKPLYYYKNQQDFVVPDDAGQVILANCTNVTVSNTYFSYGDFPVILGFCSNCIIENLSVENTAGEIILFNSCDNLVQNNVVVRSLHGICLDYKSNNNIVRNNEVIDNWIGISILTGSSNNQVHDNLVHDSREKGVGILIGTYTKEIITNNNQVFRNKVYNNSIGIKIAEASTQNTVENNEIYKNTIGLMITGQSEENIIKSNTFKRNLFPSFFTKCSNNKWENNYWNRPRVLPKIILGYATIGKIPIPWINVDLKPAKKPIEL